MIVSCKPKVSSELEQKVNSYALCKIGSPVKEESITDRGKEVLNLFRNAADEVDRIYWDQTFGNREAIDSLPEGAAKQYAFINYGPWDRVDDNKPFIEGYGKKPLGANYYPADMTKEEWDAFDDPAKLSPYTLIRRDSTGKLKAVWYHDAYKESVDKIATILQSAAAITIKPSVRNYLLKRAEALKTDDYRESDMAWMDMKDSKMDLVIGPIEEIGRASCRERV